MTYSESLTYLGAARQFGMKLGLDPMRALAAELGDPQRELRFIHVAGTNGKGSTAAFCESCLRASGYRVGLYTSPHLVSVRERIQIDRRLISEDDFAKGMEIVCRAAKKNKDHEATFFEIMTALALWTFARGKVDWVIWETGLGGRLDATNIVRPEVCIITNIGLDHQQYLGESLRSIAAEKAGIIKPGVPVISAVEEGDACEVIRERSKAEGSSLTLIHGDREVRELGLRGTKQLARIAGREWIMGLIGTHQAYNAACAVEAVRQIGLSDDVIARGLESTVWPGRFQILSKKPLIVLDGAHNSAGTKMLVETWRTFLTDRLGWSAQETDARAHLIFSAAADKDITEMAQLLSPLVRQVSLVRLANERGADPALLAQFFPGLPCKLVDSVTDMWREIGDADPNVPILITGSLFLAGEMLAQRQGSGEEYRLNERLGNPATTR